MTISVVVVVSVLLVVVFSLLLAVHLLSVDCHYRWDCYWQQLQLQQPHWDSQFQASVQVPFAHDTFRNGVASFRHVSMACRLVVTVPAAEHSILAVFLFHASHASISFVS